jgi:hypothetical protein
MILRNGTFSGKILRKIIWKIFRTGKFSTSHHSGVAQKTIAEKVVAPKKEEELRSGTQTNR